MKQSFKRLKPVKIPWLVVAIALLAVISVAIIALVQFTQSAQSKDPYIPSVRLEGQYRIDGGEWADIPTNGHISATRGNVELKGIFKLYDGQTGNDYGAITTGTKLYFYLDHIKLTLKDSAGNVWTSGNETEQLGKSACAEVWTLYEYRGASGGEVTITLYNPHVFGNEKAVDGLLGKLQLYVGEAPRLAFDGAELIMTAVTVLLVVVLIALLATAFFSSFFKVRYAGEIWLCWLLLLFGGVHFVFSSPTVSELTGMYMLNTMSLGISMMLYLLTAEAITLRFLDAGCKKIAVIATAATGLATLAAVIASAFRSVSFYNTYPYWILVAIASATALTVCIVITLIKRFEDDIASKRKYVLIPTLAVLVSFIADTAATWLGFWQGGLLSLSVLIIMALAAAVMAVSVAPKSIRAVISAKDLEAERRSMELKIQESHISIMLSQIQPHFLYNTLNSIYQLCETNPMLARSMVNSFSEYLRNNLSSLDEPGLISFETELAHIKTYLDIEKIRFDDTLEIEYDIECVDFSLPVLTVQPIVENAVKHGTSKKRGGGRVIISTREHADCYVITVTDTGCGFDVTKEKDDGKRHVGIQNVRQRLFNMCQGSLTISSEIGAGTVATIRIPKGE